MSLISGLQSRLCAVVLAICAILTVAAASSALADSGPTADEIRQALLDGRPPEIAGIRLDRTLLGAAYGARGFAPVWAAHPEMAGALVTALADAPREGLDPESFELRALTSALASASVTPLERELLLSDCFLAYARALAQGRVAPDAIDRDWALPRPEFDPATVLRRLAADGDVGASLRQLLPDAVDYARLRQALQRYRALAAAGGWPTIDAAQKIEPGQTGDLVQALRSRLVIEGDLPETLRDGGDFDAPVVAAVKHFQARHGIAVDGRVGTATMAALNVPVVERLDQLGLTLERWRTMPRNLPKSRVMVNVPAAQLTLYRDDLPQLESRIVVGDVRHPTPVLAARIVSVLFNPPWNVPSSITRKEIQPKLRRDPGYLARNHYVIIGRGEGDDHGGDVDWAHTSVLQRGWRLQQLPGAWNALGAIKLELPNPFDVYLHDTPVRQLFARPMRAASHGCVRVEAIRGLASNLLGADWPAEAIDQAVAAGDTKRVYLPAAMPVYLVYLTAFVDADGTVEFRDDIYRRDQRLAAALTDLDAHRRLAEAVGPAAGSPLVGCHSLTTDGIQSPPMRLDRG